MRISPGPGVGTGRVSATSACGPPGFGIAIAVMVAGSVCGIVSPHGFAFRARASGFISPALASSMEMI
jgi:hypothetical protein